MGHCEEEQSPSLTCLMTSYTRSAETGLAKSPSTCSETEGKERKGDQPACAKATATPQKVEEGNSGRERGRESPVGGGQLASLPIAERIRKCTEWKEKERDNFFKDPFNMPASCWRKKEWEAGNHQGLAGTTHQEAVQRSNRERPIRNTRACASDIQVQRHAPQAQ